MKRSDRKIGICVKFQKTFIRLRIVDLVSSTSTEKDLVVQVRVDVTTYRRFTFFFLTFLNMKDVMCVYRCMLITFIHTTF
jgi:hypothetical protein